MTRTRRVAIWLLCALMLLLAGTLYLLVVLPLVDHQRSWPWGWPVALVVGFLVAELLIVHLHLGREAYAFSVMEIPLVLGLFFVRPDLLVLCRVAGALIAFVHERRPLQKTAFNCALFALEAEAAVSIWHLVLGAGDPLGPRGWLAAAAVAVVTGALSSVLVGIAITVASGRWPGSMLRLFRAGLVGDLGNACFAIVAVYILTVDWRAAWLLVVIAAVLVFAYRSFEGARQRSESLEQVNRFTALVGREVELESVVRTVLTEVREAFGVATVVIRLALPGGGSQDWVLRDGPVAVGRAALVDALAAVAAGQPLL
ncbi:MAG: hypothetical protein WB798_11685, partial [Nocardioidaceae bacterium]